MARTLYGKSVPFDFTIKRNTSLRIRMVWKDENGDAYDLSGYTADMHAREHIDSADTIFERSTSDNTIILGDETPEYPKGTITILFTQAETLALDFTQGVHDLILTSSGGEASRLFEGRVFFDRSVTR